MRKTRLNPTSPRRARDAQPLSEPTAVGDQILTPGVVPVRLAERLALQLAAPIQPRRYRGPQKPCDLGLFDDTARAQTDLVDLLHQTSPTPPAKTE